jgi:molecular chaperone DnaJ
MRDLYEVLGLTRDASASDIKKAYRAMAMKYHPDRNPGDRDAEEKFKEASTAYQVLCDEEQRERYDRFGFDGIRGNGGGGGGGFSNVEDIFSAFGDLFGDFFGGGRGRGQRREQRGADLRVDLKLQFAEAVWGVQKDVKITRDVPCETCKGSGAKAGSKPETCGTCGGKGQVVHAQGFFMVQTVCPRCRGEGKTVKDPCGDCNGRRVQQHASSLTVTVPPGVDDGQSLRLAGKGETPPGGGAAGNLYVVLHVVGDERWKRDGDDIYSEVPVSFVKAALGGEVEVYTLDDQCNGKATIEVKPGTQPGDLVMRRGQGVPRVNGPGRGDHLVQLKVEIPEKLSHKAEELMRELAAEMEETVKEPKKGLFARLKK